MVGRRLALALVAVDRAGLRAGEDRLRSEDEVDAQAVVLREGELAVVPPGVEAALLVVLAEEVSEAPLLDLPQALLLLGAEEHAPPPGVGEVNVPVLRSDVEVA